MQVLSRGAAVTEVLHERNPSPDPSPGAGASILAHLRLDRLQLLDAANRHVVLMLLETSNQFTTTRLHAGTYPLRVGLARRERAPLGKRGVLIGKSDQSDRKRSERNVANTHCTPLSAAEILCIERKFRPV